MPLQCRFCSWQIKTEIEGYKQYGKYSPKTPWEAFWNHLINIHPDTSECKRMMRLIPRNDGDRWRFFYDIFGN